MKKFLVAGLFLAIALSFTPLLSFAKEGLVPCGGEEQLACTLCDLFQLINNIINIILFTFVPIIAPLFIVAGGVLMMVAGGTPLEVFKDTGAKGNPKLYNQAKAMVTAVVIGLVIIYTAWVALNTVLSSLGIASWTGLGNWWQIECAI